MCVSPQIMVSLVYVIVKLLEEAAILAKESTVLTGRRE